MLPIDVEDKDNPWMAPPSTATQTERLTKKRKATDPLSKENRKAHRTQLNKLEHHVRIKVDDMIGHSGLDNISHGTLSYSLTARFIR